MKESAKSSPSDCLTAPSAFTQPGAEEARRHATRASVSFISLFCSTPPSSTLTPLQELRHQRTHHVWCIQSFTSQHGWSSLVRLAPLPVSPFSALADSLPRSRKQEGALPTLGAAQDARTRATAQRRRGHCSRAAIGRRAGGAATSAGAAHRGRDAAQGQVHYLFQDEQRLQKGRAQGELSLLSALAGGRSCDGGAYSPPRWQSGASDERWFVGAEDARSWPACSQRRLEERLDGAWHALCYQGYDVTSTIEQLDRWRCSSRLGTTMLLAPRPEQRSFALPPAERGEAEARVGSMLRAKRTHSLTY